MIHLYFLPRIQEILNFVRVDPLSVALRLSRQNSISKKPVNLRGLPLGKPVHLITGEEFALAACETPLAR